MAPAPAPAAAASPTKGGGDHGGEDDTRGLMMYYAGVAALVAGILLSWEDETGDEFTNWIYKFHEEVILRHNEESYWLEFLEFLIAFVTFRRTYHSSVTPLFSFTYVFIREGMRDMTLDLFLGRRAEHFEDFPLAVCVWAMVNLDPMDTVFKFCQNEMVWESLEFVGACSESIEWLMHLESTIEQADNDMWAGLAMILLSNLAEPITDAIEMKLCTGKSANTDFHKTTWEFRYVNLGILAYFFAIVHPETSPLILALHPVLNKQTVLAIIAWTQIWNEVHEHFIGEVEPSSFVKTPNNMIFNAFRQPVAVGGKSA